MILGQIHVDTTRGTIDTHRDSYLLSTLTVVSVRRPFFFGGVLFGVGLGGFTAAFADLLYPQEIATLTLAAAAAVIGGWQIGQLKLLSRDLKGSELSDAIWGRYAQLNSVRRKVAAAVAAHRNGGA